MERERSNDEMTTTTPSLDAIEIASPCPASWDDMTGDDRTRFCRECRLNVYNLTAMPAADAEALIASAEGRVCVRLFRRTDGTVLTRDCPVGFAAVKRRARLAWARTVALLGVVVTGVFGCTRRGELARHGSGGAVMGDVLMGEPTIVEPRSVEAEPEALLGKVCPPTRSPQPPEPAETPTKKR